ncbi:MAG: LD-carboxypeptidase [Croceibacterium sp.]
MQRIAICAPGTPITREVAERVCAIAAAEFPQLELHFHDQCFTEQGHFAGPDPVRLAALLECANDPAFAAVWFAKGGYGSNRIAADAMVRLDRTAYDKTFLGYSDNGYLLAGLYRQDIGRPVHGPMPVDARRDGGEAAVRRALAWFAGDAGGLEPSLGERPTVAFNLITLAMLCGTELMPDLAGHVVLIEEVAEHFYAIDRLFFHISQHLKGVAGIRLGRITAVPENDRPYGTDAEAIARDWCARSGIAFLGTADIGHDAANRIVPFGLARTPARS